MPGTAQANRRGLIRAPHASDEAVSVPNTSEERRTSIHGLRQCIRALCEAAAWLSDLSPLQAACIASLCTRGTPHTSEERRTSIHSLRQCICALCEAAAWIADLSPPRVACIASLRTRGTPLAPLCGYPHDAAVSLSPCWSCEAWSRTDRCVRLDAKQSGRSLGEPQQAASEYRKRYSDALLAYVWLLRYCVRFLKG